VKVGQIELAIELSFEGSHLEELVEGPVRLVDFGAEDPPFLFFGMKMTSREGGLQIFQRKIPGVSNALSASLCREDWARGRIAMFDLE
jgi:hypothetical protein